MIIIPFGHDDLVVNRLPFITIAIILVCTVIYFPVSAGMDDHDEQQAEALRKINQSCATRPYLRLPGEMLARLPAPLAEIHDGHQEWVKWYLDSPGEVDDFLDNRLKTGSIGKAVTAELDNLLSAMGTMKGSGIKADNLYKQQKELALSEDKKEMFLSKLREVGSEQLLKEQDELDRSYEEYKKAERSSLFKRFGYVPAQTGFLGLLTHQFLHANILHLLFNLLFLWVAAVKLEDIWTRWIFFGIYLLSGIVGGIAHGLVHPESNIPLIGASGAVAGLMGAFLVRLTRTQIHFFYLFWFFRLTPRWGTFKAPAYLMLPLWFVGELANGLFFDFGWVSHWSHLGGFISGAAIALVFKFSQFEKNVLGREPEVRVDPEELPLIAFQAPDEPPLAPADPVEAARPAEHESAASEAMPAPATFEVKTVRLNIRDLIDLRVSGHGLEGKTSGGTSVRLTADDVKFIAPGRIDRIEPRRAAELFSSGSIPSEPSLVLAITKPIAVGPHLDTLPGYIIDCSTLRYQVLMRTVLPSKHKNFAAFTKLILGVYPKARYVPGPGPMAEHNVPIYSDLDEFLNHIKKCAAG
ncbi:MAG: rhomboid family intramembrane serine protease [Proteobacteria bacterium]|nr:rhomboid family intramembrane serine protease [Pseudomonadota bacterium]